MEMLEGLKAGMSEEEVEVTLPKFSFKTKYLMAKDLKEMGMPTAFSYPSADFTGISTGHSDRNYRCGWWIP